ncbi:MAG TPA: GNAT family N-acetyltransferase [Myxococcota bacterium]|nr:GNAT family N-acetyltransferase [Myxococcota bacterium]
MRHAAVTLRPARGEDAPFLRGLYASTREEELLALDWSATQRETFLSLQFEAQDRHYRAHYPQAQFDVIEREGAPVGRLVVDRRDDVIHVLDISLLPAQRGTGLGSALLRELQEEAAVRGSVIVLHVARTNPALRLYARLGFRVLHEEAIYVGMEWRPGTLASFEAQPKTAS